MSAEPSILADGVAEQELVPGIEPRTLSALQLDQLLMMRRRRRGSAPMPPGGLFDETARNQLNLF